MDDEIDLAKAIYDASPKDSSGCKELVNLVLDKTVKTKFNFTLGAADVKKSKDERQFNPK